MQRYCACGHPILMTGQWINLGFGAVMRDGKQGQAGPVVTQCPRCGRPLRARDLLATRPTLLQWPADLERYEAARGADCTEQTG